MAPQQGRSPAKYRQIAADLRARIVGGEFPVGAQIPTKPELMKSYGAALGTVDSALAVLRNLGMIESRQGMGTFVISQRARTGTWPSGLRDEVRQLTDRVESLELNLRDLYGKQGFDYPREDTGGGDSRSRAVGT